MMAATCLTGRLLLSCFHFYSSSCFTLCQLSLIGERSALQPGNFNTFFTIVLRSHAVIIDAVFHVVQFNSIYMPPNHNNSFML